MLAAIPWLSQFVAASYTETPGRQRQFSHQPQERNVGSNGGIMAEKPEPLENLVAVFDTEQESEAMVVRGLLQSAGIDAYIQSLDATQNIYPGVGGVTVVVREDQAENATAMIAEFRAHPTTDADEALSEQQDAPKP
jgi:Putative prokaryotic signal transducing protein